MLAETICSAVSAAGLGIAAVTAYRKRFLAATRIVAYSLVPIGLVMTGVIDWVSDVVFKPSVWLGFVLLGVAWLLFMITRTIERRRVSALKEREAVEPAASAPSLGAGSTPAARPQAQGGRKKKQEAASGDDFSDIEAILKKHGL
ncbi:MAG TPA: hypothetical protein VIS29_11320 [Streptomyces sp.]|jgi:hypothetical protein